MKPTAISFILTFGTAILTFGTAAALSGCGRSPAVSFMSCSLKDAQGASQNYSFEVDSKKPRLYWVEGSQEMRIVRNTDSQLWAEHGAKSKNFDYNLTGFKLNRVTGEASVSYSKKPSAAEVQACGKEWWCTYDIVLSEHDEHGTCTRQDRKI